MSNPNSVEREPPSALRNRRITVVALAVAAIAFTVAGVVGGALGARQTAVEPPSIGAVPVAGAPVVQTLHSAHSTIPPSQSESAPPTF